jgi:diaminopimelate epimerase
MRSIPFFKYQALGNDFVLFDSATLTIHGVTSSEAQAALAIRVCDRHIGIGSDGMLVVDNDKIVFFNPDGTLDQCGNGIRASALHLFRQKKFSEKTFQTQGGSVVVVACADLDEGGRQCFSARHTIIALPKKMSVEVPGHDRLEGYLVDMGTPHFCVPAISFTPMLGALLEHAAAFAQPVTVDFLATDRLHEGVISLRIWERSVGETLGCGTGAMAAALTAAFIYEASQQQERLTWTVHSPGGVLSVKLNKDAAGIVRTADLIGTAEFVFSGNFFHANT